MIDRPTLIKVAVGALAVLILAGASGVLLREPILHWGAVFMDRFGLWGLFVGVVISDSSIVPLTNEPLVLLAISGGTSPWLAFAITALGSTLAGPLGWLYGRTLARHTRLGPLLLHRYPSVFALLRRYGVRFVAMAAVFPFPFSVTTWLAGMAGLPLHQVALASLWRIPKTAFYVALLVGGWSLGG